MKPEAAAVRSFMTGQRERTTTDAIRLKVSQIGVEYPIIFMMHLLPTALLSAVTAVAQAPPAAQHSTSFNSSFALSPEQIKAASITETQATNLNNVFNFDRSQLANGGPHEDDFYSLPPLFTTNGSDPPPQEPGTLLKVQDFTDTSPFVVPPNTALSRILYTTKNHNGTVLPASAYVLWPYQARKLSARDSSAGAPAVLWAHGTSGFFASAAPSSHRARKYLHTYIYIVSVVIPAPFLCMLSSEDNHIITLMA